jgi:uncharacterized protein (DUF1499 family)
MWPMLNDVETGKTAEYPDLVPQRFSAGADDVLVAVENVARSLRRWTVVEVNPDAGLLRAVYTTALFRFKDDVTVRVHREDDGTVVRVRSKSRIGKGDLGQNARTIRAFQQALARVVS